VNEASDLKAAVAAYIDFYEFLTPDSLHRLNELCASEVRFRDPFNDVTGVVAYRAILAQMFQDVSDPHFTVVNWALSGRIAYLRWDFTFRRGKGEEPWSIEGMSEVYFDDEGRVIAHLDHWDSGTQFYGRLPVLRPLIAFLRRRLSLKPR
jgi:hypothetical protein